MLKELKYETESSHSFLMSDLSNYEAYSNDPKGSPTFSDQKPGPEVINFCHAQLS